MTTIHYTSLDSLIEAYTLHERDVRGLSDRTVSSYAEFAYLFTRFALGDDPINPALLRGKDVIVFVQAMQGRFSSRSMKPVGTALRSFFRFLRVTGVCEQELETAIPKVAHWRLATLPRALDDAQLQQVFDTLESTGPHARRDRAIVLSLATLGLRPGELANLRLADCDWRNGMIHIRVRKTQRGATLPMPDQVGQAIAGYLRDERPATAERRIFVQHLAPRRGEPLSSNALSGVAVRAIRRAGIEPPIAGGYVFRHTVASQMVQSGASLKEVGDFLGHRSLDTTTVYAKVNTAALREVALPWPETMQ